MKFIFAAILCIIMASCSTPADPAATPEIANPLPSFSEEAAQRIMHWVQMVTDTASDKFIPAADRIAVFDNDGTLWPEQPVPFQAIFAADYVRTHAGAHPEWQKNEVLRGAAKGDWGPLKQQGINGLITLVNASHTGMTADTFSRAVLNWLDTARHPLLKLPYTQLVYQPMLELLEYLRNHGFTTFIVSGGGADFMRAWAYKVYGIPAHQVIGSYGEAAFEVRDGKPVILKKPGKLFVDDKEGKPVAIHRFIGKVPVFCGGNSDGDLAMMQYTASSPYTSMCMLIHHTDSTREFAYDVKTISGHLEKALTEAKARNWMIVDMQHDFKKVYPDK